MNEEEGFIPRFLLVLMILAGAASASAQEPPSITDVEVNPTPFSPNGDGVRELLRLEYTLSVDASSVTAAVRDADGFHVAVLLDGAFRPAGKDTLIWNGLTDNLSRAPDGTYFVHLSARNSVGQTEEDSPFFVLDATTPTARITELYPKPFAPALPPSPDSLTVRISVSGSQAEDSISVTVGPKDEPADDALSLTPPFSGDGEYLCYWKDKGDPDGFYRVEVFMQDVALNRSTDDSSFLLDRSPPLIEVLDPPDGAILGELPDLLQAKVYDESGVDSLEISYDGRPFAVVPNAAGQDTVYWTSPLRDSLPGEGEHTVRVRATDLLGRLGARDNDDGVLSISLTTDTEPPPPPSLDPLPPVVRTARIEVTGTADDADSVMVYLNDFENPALALRVTIKDAFSGALNLRSGVNELAAISVDEAGNQSDFSSSVTVEYRQEFGVFFNKRFRPGNAFEISLDRPAREVTLALYSTSGRMVRLLRGDGPSSAFSLTWDGYDDSGTSLNSGVYLCRVNAVLEDGTSLTQKKLVALVR